MENRIAEYRLRKGLKQVELARLLKWDRSQLNRIEKGTQKPTVETAMKIAKALECSIEQIFFEGNVALSVKKSNRVKKQ